MKKLKFFAVMIGILLILIACGKKEVSQQPEIELQEIAQELPSDEEITTPEIEEAAEEIKDINEEKNKTFVVKETVLKEGKFRIQTTPTFGDVLIVERNTFKYLVFERFSTVPMPQTNVYLSLETTSNPSTIQKKSILLGPLKAEKGSQEYELPGDIVIELYRSVVLYSPERNSVLGYAPLNPVLEGKNGN